VLGRFQLTIEGCPTSLPVQAQRLLALLAEVFLSLRYKIALN
jgi:hypothetical protein